MANQINKVTNANVYVNGTSLLGRAEEVSLPDVNFIMSEHKALGMGGPLQHVSGIDKLEGKIKWNSFYSDVLKTFANPYKAISLMIRSSVEIMQGQDLADEKPLVVYMTAASKKWPLGSFKQNDNVELETEFVISQLKVEYDGVLMMEIDIQASIFNVGGGDLWAKRRENMGL